MGSSVSRPTSITSAQTTSLPRLGLNWKTTKCDAAAAPPPPPLLPPGSINASSSGESDAAKKTNSNVDTTKGPELSDANKSSNDLNIAGIVPLFSNPGTYETAPMEAGKGTVTLDTHDGFRCDISKQLSPYFAAVHSFWLGTAMLPDGRNKTYSFVAQVADENGLLMARMDPERGSVDGRIHTSILGGLAMCKLQLGLSGEKPTEKQPDAGQNDQALGEIDFGGNTWTANLKYGSMGQGLMFGCNYFQAVTRKLAMGGEGMYIATNSSLLSSYTLKYTHDNLTSEPDSGTTSFSSSAPPKDGTAVTVINYNTAQSLLSLNYKRIVTPNRVTLAAELQCSPQTLDSQVLLGAEVKLNRSKVGLAIDGTGKIQSVLETKLGMAPGSPTLNFCAEVDHGKDVMRFGYGLNIGG